MSRIHLKNLPSLKLETFLKRKKITLEYFVKDANITNYSEFVNLCNRMGCEPSSKKVFLQVQRSLSSHKDVGACKNSVTETLIEEKSNKKIKKDLVKFVKNIVDENNEVNRTELNSGTVVDNKDDGELQDSNKQPSSDTRKKTRRSKKATTKLLED